MGQPSLLAVAEVDIAMPGYQLITSGKNPEGRMTLEVNSS